MRAAYLIVGVVLAFIARVIYSLDFHRQFDVVRKFDNCQYTTTDMRGPEDMAVFRDDIIIVTTGNFGDLFYKNLEFRQNGIYAIHDSSKANYSVKKIPIDSFPEGVALYCHGIYIRNNQLFVINHAYKFGGERIEIFDIAEGATRLTYRRSLIMDPEYNGVLNDLIIVSDQRFLITKFLAYAHPLEGRNVQTGWNKIKQTAATLLKIRKTFVLDCKFNELDSTPKCNVLDNTYATMANGITWDRANRVWVADTVESVISEYKLVENGLEYVRAIQADSKLDNLDFENGKLSFAIIGKMIDLIKLEGFHKENILTRDTKFDYTASIVIYDLEKDEYQVIAQGDHLGKGATGALIRGDNLFITSWCDISLMVCKRT